MDQITKDQMIELRGYTEGKGGTGEFYAEDGSHICTLESTFW